MTKPNLLLIMCDQLRADALGCYGNEFVKTPNIDRLAAQGMRFDRAYSQTPVCVPARYGLISGQRPFELGLVSNGTPGEVQHPLPEILRESGYATVVAGKMHFSPPRNHYGFDRMLLSEEIPDHIADDDFLQYLQAQGLGNVYEPHGKRSENYYVPQVSPLPAEHHTTGWTGKTTCEQLRQNQNRPTFIFTSFIKPHPPFDPCVPYDAMYDDTEMPAPAKSTFDGHEDDYLIARQNDYKVNGIENVSAADIEKMQRAYYGCVSQIDAEVGRILDTLEETGMAENTLVILTADHGEMLGDHDSFGKRTFYEPSTRIPFIARWPEHIQSGNCDQLMILQDIYATFIAAAGGEIPEGSCSRDFIPLLKDAQTPWRDCVIGEIGRGPELKMMLLRGDLKYIYHCNGGVEHLFDLKKDPAELANIAAENTDYCKSCRDELAGYYKGADFEDALEGDVLKVLSPQSPPKRGFLNQYPRWPETVVD